MELLSCPCSKQRHKHLAAVLGVCTDLRQPYIITEYIDGEPFKELLKHTGEAAMKMTKRIKLVGVLTPEMYMVYNTSL